MQVLVVDDEASIRELLAFNLKKAGYEVCEAEDGKTALSLARKQLPMLMLLDLMLPQMDGLEVCRQLKEDHATANIPIIMLTAKDEEIDKVLGLELGADDYVTKPFSMRELMSRVKAVLRRSNTSPGVPEGALMIGPLRMDFGAYEAFVAEQKLSLTPKEYELLKLFATNDGKAFSRDELLEKVWGYEYYGDTRTVDVHVRHLRAKLDGAQPALGEIIETVRGKGYRFARNSVK